METGDWVLLVAIAMLMTTTISVIFYLLSKIFRSPELEFRAKGYLTDVISTALVVSLVFAFIYILLLGGRMLAISHMVYAGLEPEGVDIQKAANDMGTMVGNWPNIENLFTFVLTKLNDPEYKQLKEVSCPNIYAMFLLKDTAQSFASLYKIVNTVYFLMKAISKTSIVKNGGGPSGFFAKGIFPVLYGVVEFFMDKLDTAIFAQYMFLEIMRYGMYLSGYLIPLGVVLRLLPSTRGVGGMLIAFGLGFGYIVHIAYIYVFVVTENIAPTNMFADLIHQIEDSNEYIMAKEALRLAMEDCRLDLSDIPLFISAYGGVLPLFKRMVTHLLNTFVVFIVYRALLYPTIVLTILYTFIRSAGLMLGADLSEIARGVAKVI